MTVSARPTLKPALPRRARTPVSRREFLYYLLGGSGALLAAGTCAGVTWFARQNMNTKLEGGVALDLKWLPTLPNDPALFRPASCWLVNVEGKLLALSGICTWRPSLVMWSPLGQRYQCPSCGSLFALDGSSREGPALHGLDTIYFEMEMKDGTVQTALDAKAFDRSSVRAITLYPNIKIQGKSRGS
jgi:hypothetical protein